jgi:hypothetical protein
LGVSREGEFKNTIKMFVQKVHSPCRKLFPKQPTKISMSVFPRFFWVLSRFWVFHSDGSSKTLKNTFCKNRQKITNGFFVDFVYHVFGRFSVREFKKRHKKVVTKSLCRKLFQTNGLKFQCQFLPRLFCFITSVGVSRRGEFKHTIKKHESDPGPFLASEPPIHHGGRRIDDLLGGGWAGQRLKKDQGQIYASDIFLVVFSNSPRRETPTNVIKQKNRGKTDIEILVDLF